MLRKYWPVPVISIAAVLVLVLIYFPLLQYPRAIKNDTATYVPRTVHYKVVVDKGIFQGESDFDGEVRRALSDVRGWSKAGITFTQVSAGPDLVYELTKGDVIKKASPICDDFYNCTVNNRVYVNTERWKWGDGWPGEADEYHALIINHETGHYIGLNHWKCICMFEPAPVMMTHQDVGSFHWWRPNAWPTRQEVRAASTHIL